MNNIDKLVVIKSLTLNDFIKELSNKIYDNEDKVKEAIDRQLVLERCVYILLAHRKPTDQDYMSVTNNLFTIQDELRNPNLINRASERFGGKQV